MVDLLDQFRSVGCHCEPESAQELVSALEARSTILFFWYYMYTAQALYSEEALGRIKEQKRSEYNCNYYRAASATSNPKRGLKMMDRHDMMV